LTLAGAVGRA